MGRVYDVNPDTSKGELPPPTIDGQWPEVWLLSRGKWGGTRRLCGVHRIEFDDDADEGMATIHCYLGSNSTGTSPILNYDGTEAVSVTFRHYVQFRSKKIDGEHPTGTLPAEPEVKTRLYRTGNEPDADMPHIVG